MSFPCLPWSTSPSPVVPLAGGGGHGWRGEQMAGRVTSVARLSGPIIPPDGPPALLLFPAPGRPGLPRQRRMAAMRGCPGSQRAAPSPSLVPLLLRQRELDLLIPAQGFSAWCSPSGEGDGLVQGKAFGQSPPGLQVCASCLRAGRAVMGEFV